MRLVQSLGIAVLLILTGCQSAPEGEITVDEGEPLVFDMAARGQSAATRDTLEVIVRTEDEWSRVSEQFQPVNPFPEFDFSQTMLGVISIPVNTGGFSIDIDSVEMVDSTLAIAYVLNVPGATCITPQALAEAWRVFTIRQTDFAEVEFTRRTEWYNCDVRQ